MCIRDSQLRYRALYLRALARAAETAVPQAATATTVSPLTIDQNDPNSAVLFTSDSTGPMSLMA